MFHELPNYAQDAALAERTRKLIGDGTPFLQAPGLKSLEAIRVGSMEIPLQMTEQVPTDSTLQTLETVQVELVRLDVVGEVPVLRRSLKSNHGFWQSGETFYVTGEWDPEPADPKSRKNAAPAA